MKRIYTHYLMLLLPLAFTACLYGEEPQADLLPVTVRRQQALDSLRNKLINQPYGWTTIYEPNKGAIRQASKSSEHDKNFRDRKKYPLLLKFFENNTVNILSQLELPLEHLQASDKYNTGLEVTRHYKKKDMFKNHTLDFRVSLRQQVSLVFETYGIFHYLISIKKESVTPGRPFAYVSGADFEFGYERSSGDTLHFVSLSDKVILNEAQLGGSRDITPSVFWLVPAKKNSINQFK